MENAAAFAAAVSAPVEARYIAEEIDYRVLDRPSWGISLGLIQTARYKLEILQMEYIKLLRISQWTKNVFVLLPMLFGGYLFDVNTWVKCLFAWIMFSLSASSIYCLNDSIDYKQDKKHLLKKDRPIASGKISPETACIISLLLFTIVSVVFLIYGSIKEYFVILVYWLLNLLYSLWLKRVAIIDVMIIAFGFVLRVLFGGFVTDIWVSPWMICMVFILTLFLAFTKRRGDVLIQVTKNEIARDSVKSFNLVFVDMIISMLAAVTIVSYFIFTMNDEVISRAHSQNIYITSIFVLAAIIRYLQIILTGQKINSPDNIIAHDKFIIGCILCWIASYLFILYF